MKIHLVSDIHLEFCPGGKLSYEAPEGTDVVIVAGDTNPGVKGLMWAAETFGSANGMPVIYLAGNHEFYGGRRFNKHYAKMREKATDLRILFLQNDTVVIDGVRFLGTTLWTNFKLNGDQPLAMLKAAKAMNDYIYIRQGTSKEAKLTPQTVLGEHELAMEFLTKELSEEHDGTTVVVTHHAPSEESCYPEFARDASNVYYASSLENFVLEHSPELWVHGHIHQSKDYMIGDTRVAANPRGYDDGFVNANFDPNLLLEV